MKDTNIENQGLDGASRSKGDVASFFRHNIVAILIIAAIVAGYFIFRTAPSDVASIAELDTHLSSGQPVLIEFYSNT